MIKWFEKEDLVSIALVVLIAIFIFYISAQSFEKGSPGPNFRLKPILYHFGIFFLLSLFASISLIKGKFSSRYLVFISIIFVVAFAATDELHQLFVINRTCTIEDFLVDTSGIILASLSYFLLLVFRNSSSQVK